MRNNPLINTLLNIRGNPKACIYTEPLWAIPFNLYIPFVSVYMSALFLTDSQIGLVASVSMFFMAIFALLSGAITDKLGRRLATFIFDTLSWSIPCLLWAFSQNVWWFIVAAAFNGMVQIPNTSWLCLLVEDAEKHALVGIFSLLHLIGQLSVIFAPIAAIMVGFYTIVPVMRVLYLITFVAMTLKFIIFYKLSEETEVGKVRKKETADMSIFKIMSGYGQILRRVLVSREMKLAFAISAILYIATIITSNFFGLYITGPLMIPDQYLAYYPIVRSVVVVFFLFFVQSRLTRFGLKNPMLIGVLLFIAGHVILLISPHGNLIIPFVYILIEACAFSLVIPSKDSLVAMLIDPDERARISSIMTFLVLCFSIPFGYLAGWMSDMDRRLPFLLNIGLFVLVFLVILVGGKLMDNASKEPN